MAILEGGHIVPPPHSSYIQKPRAIRVKNNQWSVIEHSKNRVNLEKKQLIIKFYMLQFDDFILTLHL